MGYEEHLYAELDSPLDMTKHSTANLSEGLPDSEQVDVPTTPVYTVFPALETEVTS